MLHPSLYEQLIIRALRQELESIPAERKSVAPVDPAEATEVFSRCIAEAAKRVLSGLIEKEKAAIRDFVRRRWRGSILG